MLKVFDSNMISITYFADDGNKFMLTLPKKKNLQATRHLFGLNHYFYYLSNLSNQHDVAEIESFIMNKVISTKYYMDNNKSILKKALYESEEDVVVEEIEAKNAKDFFNEIINNRLLMKSLIEYALANTNMNLEEIPEELEKKGIQKLYSSDIICLIVLGMYTKLFKIFECAYNNIYLYTANDCMNAIDKMIYREYHQLQWKSNTLDTLRDFTESLVTKHTDKNDDALVKFMPTGLTNESIVSDLISTLLTKSLKIFVPRYNIKHLTEEFESAGISTKEKLKKAIESETLRREKEIEQKVMDTYGLPYHKYVIYRMDEEYYNLFSYSEKNTTAYIRTVIDRTVQHKTDSKKCTSILKTIDTSIQNTASLDLKHEKFISKFNKGKLQDITSIIKYLEENLESLTPMVLSDEKITGILSNNVFSKYIIGDYIESFGLDIHALNRVLLNTIITNIYIKLKNEGFDKMAETLITIPLAQTKKTYYDYSRFKSLVQYQMLGENFINRVDKLMQFDYSNSDNNELLNEMYIYLKK